MKGGQVRPRVGGSIMAPMELTSAALMYQTLDLEFLTFLTGRLNPKLHVGQADHSPRNATKAKATVVVTV